MKNQKNERRNLNMKVLIGSIAFGLAILMTLSMFASFSQAALSVKNTKSTSNYNLATDSGKLTAQGSLTSAKSDKTQQDKTQATSANKNLRSGSEKSNKKTAQTTQGDRVKAVKSDEQSSEKKVYPSKTVVNETAKGDVNGDGNIDFGDIDWFRMVYDNQNFFRTYHPDMFWRTDIDDSESIDGTDVDLFVALLSQ